MKVIRIAFKPDGAHYIYMGTGGDDFDLPKWWYAVKREGAALAAQSVVPVDTIHHVLVEELPEAPPNLHSITGGKLN